MRQDLIPLQQRHLSNPVWAIPAGIVEAYARLGITTMFHWQAECLARFMSPGSRPNLVYTAQTSGGKSLVADLIMLKTVLEQNTKAIVVLPFVSLVTEKTALFRKLLSAYPEINVAAYHGASIGSSPWNQTNIALCTIEKANTLFNSVLEEKRTAELGCVIVDELHLLDQPRRGLILEILLSKVIACEINAHLLGMTATVDPQSMLQMAKWLKADYYSNDIRPVPLYQFLVIEGSIRSIDMPGTDRALNMAEAVANISDAVDRDVVALALETVKQDHSCLVFTSTRKAAARIASLIARHSPPNIDHNNRFDLFSQSKAATCGASQVPGVLIQRGLAFHHAGLTIEERDVLEQGFNAGVLKVLVATPTLAVGVNLPARRVVFHTPYIGAEFLDTTRYRQMSGRAGRKGRDVKGESFLCCRNSEAEDCLNFIHAAVPRLSSALGSDLQALCRAILETVAVDLTASESAVKQFCKCTFFYADESFDVLNERIFECVSVLRQYGLICDRTDMTQGAWKATLLGKAIVAAAMPIEEGLFLHRELQRSLCCFNLVQELVIEHRLLEKFDALSEGEKQLGISIGVNPGMIAKKNLSRNAKAMHENEEVLRIHQRFYAALILQHLIAGAPSMISFDAGPNLRQVMDICRDFAIEPGFLQSLQSQSTNFASTVSNFASIMEWKNFAMIINNFKDRITFGVRAELLEFSKLFRLYGAEALAFWESGLRNPYSIAKAEHKDLAQILTRILPKTEDNLKVVAVRRKIAKKRALKLKRLAEGLCQLERAHDSNDQTTISDVSDNEF